MCILPELRAVCEAYADGLNYYAALHKNKILAELIFPVSGKDVVASFLNKIPSFIKLDETLKEMFGKRILNQQINQLERTKSKMSLRVKDIGRHLFEFVFGKGLESDEYFVNEEIGKTMKEDTPQETKPVIKEEGPVSIIQDEESGIAKEERTKVASTHDAQSLNENVASFEVPNAGQVDIEFMSASHYEATQKNSDENKSESTDNIGQEIKEQDQDGLREELKAGFASSAFAVAADKTADGSTVLIINPHQPWTGPFSWYEFMYLYTTFSIF